MLVKKSISSVPILDRAGTVLNVFEAVDVITLIKGGVYDDLNLTVGDALLKRSDVSIHFFLPFLRISDSSRTSLVSSPVH